MLTISAETMAALGRAQREGFLRAQPARLRDRLPAEFARAFPEPAAAQAFADALVGEAMTAGIRDADDLQQLLDACLSAGWVTPAARAAAGVAAILADPAPAPVEKATRVVNAAAFAVAARMGDQ